MLARIPSLAIVGVDAVAVSVEVDVTELPGDAPSTYSIVGLGDAAIKEARERLRSALKNSGVGLFQKRVTINLAPADLRKEGSHLDLPMALGALVATGRLKSQAPFAAAGELGLDGTIQRLHGALPIAAGARAEGIPRILLPAENAAEAACVEGIEIIPVATLREAVDFLNGQSVIAPARPEMAVFGDEEIRDDLEDVKGQEGAKRALEIAAAGSHNLLFLGPPGSGKTMLARRLPGILPPLGFEEALEASKIHSIAGALPPKSGLLRARPFRAPHHTASPVSLIGGGPVPRPGEVSLAHHGVLFLDELPEFSRTTLEVLRQPLEDGVVQVARAAMSVAFPARIVLVAAMNPCPCGLAGHPSRACVCSPVAVQKYLSRISGPLLDRIDMHVEVPAVPLEQLRERRAAEGSGAVRARVLAARERQRERFRGRAGIHANGHMSAKELNEFCHLEPAAQKLLETAIQRLNLSARAYDRLRKLARTIADLAASDTISPSHVSEAVQYRSLDRLGV
ncbi:MAG: YifB family Mg chelatase-like AAA ATPase [Candidatus Sumerlaeia bacterium]|nr:YifB family Mg chelatase-like AAA ATPase [Candidatus Sumerlaeia bacterium]